MIFQGLASVKVALQLLNSPFSLPPLRWQLESVQETLLFSWSVWVFIMRLIRFNPPSVAGCGSVDTVVFWQELGWCWESWGVQVLWKTKSKKNTITGEGSSIYWNSIEDTLQNPSLGSLDWVLQSGIEYTVSRIPFTNFRRFTPTCASASGFASSKHESLTVRKIAAIHLLKLLILRCRVKL